MGSNDAAGATILVNIDVSDLGRATAFYCEAFGLRVGRRLGQSAIELVGASFAIYLLARPPGSPATDHSAQRRDYGRHWTPVHLDFVIPDVDRAVERAKAAGALVESEVRTHDWGRIALMSDPFGHGFCLIEFRGRGYDEIATSPGSTK